MGSKFDEPEDDVFQDTPEYSPKSEFSKPRVVEEYVKKLYPNTVDLKGIDFKDNLTKTKELIEKKRHYF